MQLHHESAHQMIVVLVAAAVIALAGIQPVYADHEGDHFWVNSAGGDFETPANWDPAAMPEEDDAGIFTLDETYTIFFSDDRDNHRLRMHAGDVTFDIGEHMYRLVGSNGIYVGIDADDDAILRVTSGLLRGVTGSRLGDAQNSAGTVFIAGEEAIWHHTSSISIGHAGAGTLTVTDGGTFQGPTSSATTLGSQSTGIGHVTVSGPGSTWSQWFSTNIGSNGTGTVLIENGGSVVLDSCWLARSSSNSEGHVLVTGEGSFFKTGDGAGASHTRVARLGTATLIIEDGATAETITTRIGELASGHGTVIVRGPGSLWDASTVRIGGRGTGLVRVEDGGAIEGSTVLVGYQTHSSGDGDGTMIVTGAGSSWDASNIYLGGTSSSPGGTGSLTIGPGATVSVNNTFRIWQGENNTLRFVVGGINQCGYGFLEVGGVMDLAGDNASSGILEIELAGGYEPSDGHSFKLFDAESIEGQFDDLTLPELTGGVQWDISELYTDGVISAGPAAAPCPADLTGSGSVDVSDLLLILSAWGECAAPCPADLTCSGQVNVSDLLMLLAAWGDCPR